MQAVFAIQNGQFLQDSPCMVSLVESAALMLGIFDDKMLR